MTAGQFAGIQDDELLRQAASHLRKGLAFTPGTLPAMREQKAFHELMAEYNRRELARLMKVLAAAARVGERRIPAVPDR